MRKDSSLSLTLHVVYRLHLHRCPRSPLGASSDVILVSSRDHSRGLFVALHCLHLTILSIFSRPFELEGDVSNVMLLSPNPVPLQKMYFKSIISQITIAARFVRGLNRL